MSNQSLPNSGLDLVGQLFFWESESIFVAEDFIHRAERCVVSNDCDSVYGIRIPPPIAAAVGRRAARRLSGTGGTSHGAQLPGL